MVDKQVFVFAGNHGYANQGCEAIVRGTTKILRTVFNNPEFYSAYFFQEGCTDKVDESDKGIKHLPITSLNRFSEKWFTYQFAKILNPKNKEFISYTYLKPYINEANAVLMLGGDNYSLDYGYPEKYLSLNHYVRAQNIPVILWGTSIGPFSTEPEYEKKVVAELKKVTRIYARESITYRYLKSHGVEENVRLVADPSYFVDPILFELPEKIENVISQGCVGLNISPLLCRYLDNNLESWIVQATEIVTFLTKVLPVPLLLIPHVVSYTGNMREDDYIFLNEVFKRVNCTNGKLFLLEGKLTTAETKWVISRLIAFAGARTHATLAALSTGVPTISIGYSSKSQGINEDIYGHTNWLIKIKELTPDHLVGKIKDLLTSRETIHSDLLVTIQTMRNRALLAGEDLAAVL
jgi:colanic acid/amylovoran biosynthesis protein